jgi:Asp-tRNA(Asn)/Glu-tRNA(Gln) amidotransferase A subunit family amidase
VYHNNANWNNRPVTSTATALAWCDATELRQLMTARSVSAREVVGACLERIAEREPELQAWEALDARRALREADARDAEAREAHRPVGPLHGVPIGVKDLIDTADFPTAYGSQLYAGHRPGADARVVTALRDAGAVVLGKTVTTEFGSFAPARTRNPHDLERTPGGSSSGSAAAVADGMVPIALGTQTAGSVIRPAAYCGVFAFKPSHDRWDRRGAKLVSPTLDTLGALARTARDLELVDAVLAAVLADTATQAARPPTIGILEPPEMPQAEESMRRALEQAASLLGEATRVLPRTLRDPMDRAAQAQATIMSAEMAAALAPEARRAAGAATETLLALTDRSAVPSAPALKAARDLTARCREALPATFEGCDVLLLPAALGEPPLRASTGDPVCCRAWTLLGCPAVAIPGLRGPAGLPVGLQLVGPPGSDRRTLAAARWIGERLATGADQRPSGAGSG